MVPFDYAQRVLLSNGSTTAPAIFRQESHTLTVLGNPALRRGSYSFRHQVERQCEYNSLQECWQKP